MTTTNYKKKFLQLNLLNYTQKANKEEIHPFLEKLKNKNSHEKGELFERFVIAYLRKVPPHKDIFVKVWRWKDYPQRGNRLDCGIDIVAQDKEGNLWAIQAKFHSNKITLSDISTFLTSSGTKEFQKRMLITISSLTGNAEKALREQEKPIVVYTLDDILESIDESNFDWTNPDYVKPAPKKKIRSYQQEAIESVFKGFKNTDRGKLIMPPGSGKTFTALKIAEKIVGKGGRVLFLCPSIALLDQSIRAWERDSEIPLRLFAVVSDRGVGKNEDSLEKVTILRIPPTTNPDDLLKYASKEESESLTVIFSTYHSLEVIEQAQRMGLPEFDLIICDEAHRTTGVKATKKELSFFQKVHYNDYIKGKKRLYMTATPRIYEPNIKAKLEEMDINYYSMDDRNIYGETFYEYTFRRAVDEGYLSDYKVIVLEVDEKDAQEKLYDYFQRSKALSVDYAAKVLGSWNVLQGKIKNEDNQNYPLNLKRIIIFTGKIAESRALAEEFNKVADEYFKSEEKESFKKIEIRHIDGSMSSTERKKFLDWLRGEASREVRILTNAKVLTEGIDVPALDAIIFMKPKDSVVDIVQAVGRVMRKAQHKAYGYVVIPVVIRPNRSESEQIEKTSYKTVWQVLNALRSLDETFEAKARQLVLKLGKQETGIDQKLTGDKPDDDSVIIIAQPTLIQSQLPFSVRKALVGKIAKSLALGKKYLENWAKEVSEIAQRLQTQVEIALKKEEIVKNKFDTLLFALRGVINEEITKEDAISMLVQHMLTKPIFEALFENYDFIKGNPVAHGLEEISTHFEKFIQRETKDLESFYRNVRIRASGIDKEEERQDFLRQLYDSFFRIAFKDTAEKLGIVYTPVEVVDFIIKSVDYLLRKEWNSSLADNRVVVLEPFMGTGTFLARLFQHLPENELKRKYLSGEIWGNEILLLPYYIGKMNIESSYYDRTGEYRPFKHLLLTDSFQMMELIYESRKYSEILFFPKQYSELLNAQKKAKVNVIISNPPWFKSQSSENQGIKKTEYSNLTKKVKGTYALYSRTTNKIALKDSYILAFRMASDRIEKRGIIGFVTNNGWLDSSATDGMRKCLEEEFARVYVFNLRGNARKQGKERKKEGGNVFGEGTRAGVCIVFLIKDDEKLKKQHGKAEIYYYQVEDYLNREEKLQRLKKFSSVENVPWKRIIPNSKCDWINQRGEEFYQFPVMGDKKNKDVKKIFNTYSLGLLTNRDAWVYNLSRNKLEKNMKRMITEYNRHARMVKDIEITKGNLEEIIEKDESKIKWDSTLKRELIVGKGREYDFNLAGKIFLGNYRPFIKMWAYFSRTFNNSIHLLPQIFPEPNIENIAICVSGRGALNFSALIVRYIPSVDFINKTQIFPFYRYLLSNESLLHVSNVIEICGKKYKKEENITDWALEEFHKHYGKEVSKEDIFYYIYGILHSPKYKEKFKAELKKDLPRIPFVKDTQDFWTFSKAGRELAYWHLNYETVEPYPLEVEVNGNTDDFETYKITKMKLNEKEGIFYYNDLITIRGIPREAFNYRVNGKHPLKWLVEFYQVKEKGKTKIIWDPNDWLKEHNNPTYVLELIGRLVRVSLETQNIVKSLPKLGE